MSTFLLSICLIYVNLCMYVYLNQYPYIFKSISISKSIHLQTVSLWMSLSNLELFLYTHLRL